MLDADSLLKLRKAWSHLQQSPYWQISWRRLPGTITFLLTVIVLYRLADLTWMLLPKPQLAVYTPPTKSQPLQKSGDNAYNALQISSWSLFGKPAKLERNKEQTVKTANLKEAKLDLTLKGITHSLHKHDSFAIITDTSSGKEKNYKIGDTLPGNAKIEQILQNSVILIHNNERVKLKFKKRKQALNTLPNNKKDLNASVTP